MSVEFQIFGLMAVCVLLGVALDELIRAWMEWRKS